jgi:hypothetical protein
MSNIIPSANKIHVLGKANNSEIIRWKELWVGSIDADEKIKVSILNIDENDISNQLYDAFKIRGHISLNTGDFFIKDFLNNEVYLNLAEEIKTASVQLNNYNQGIDSNKIIQINEISVNNPFQYNSNNKILTLYTNDIPESPNSVNGPAQNENHLWWTDDRFDYSFSNKKSTDLADSALLLRKNENLIFTNNASNNFSNLIPGLNTNTMKIDKSFLPDNIINDVNLLPNKDLIVGTMLERDFYQNPFEGLFWKILDNINPINNDQLFIYNGNNWIELVGSSINQDDIVKQINSPDLLTIDNSKNVTNFTISNIKEYQNINFNLSKPNVYFSRERLNDSIESPNNTILITKDTNNKTNLSLVGYNPISSTEQLYQSIGMSVVPNSDPIIMISNNKLSIADMLKKSWNFRNTDNSSSSLALASVSKGLFGFTGRYYFEGLFCKDTENCLWSTLNGGISVRLTDTFIEKLNIKTSELLLEAITTF